MVYSRNINKRFDVLFEEGNFSGNKIIVDRETGVNYLFSWVGNAGGLTPLLGEDKNVIVTPTNEQ